MHRQLKIQQRGRATITAPRMLLAREREERAVARRLAGASYSAIGAELGISPQAAHKHVMLALRRQAAKLAESTDHLRQIEAARLDELLVALWPKATRGDLAAVDRVLAIAARRARLFGLDVERRELTGAGGAALKLDVASMIYLPGLADERGEIEAELVEVELAAEPAK